MDKALTSAHLAIPAETDMYVPQMVGRRLKDPTQAQAPIQPPELLVVRRVQPPAPEPKDPTPLPAPKPPPELRKPPAAPDVPDFGFESITVPPAPEAKKPPPTDFSFDRIEVVPPPPAPKVPVGDTDSDDSWYCSLPEIAPPPPPRPARDPRAHAPIRPRLEPIACTETTQVVDASVLIDTVRQRRTAKTLPMPARPLSAPLVLGVFAALAALFLPMTVALEGNRIFGILGVCVSGLLLPIAPLAWIAGLAAERRRREQGLRTERRVLVGRLLGQWGTMLLAAEGTLGLFLVAAFRITGKFPISFWAP
jgi:hypothetical protein